MKRWNAAFKFRWPGGQITTESEVVRANEQPSQEDIRAIIDHQHGKGAFVELIHAVEIA